MHKTRHRAVEDAGAMEDLDAVVDKRPHPLLWNRTVASGRKQKQRIAEHLFTMEVKGTDVKFYCCGLTANERFGFTGIGSIPESRMEPRDVRFYRVRGAVQPGTFDVLFGYPFKREGGGDMVVGLFGDLVADGKPLTEEQYMKIGLEPVLDAEGKPAMITALAPLTKRKYYMPGNYGVPFLMDFQIVGEKDGVKQVKVLESRRIPSSAEEVEDVLRRLDGNADEIFATIRKDLEGLARRAYEKTDKTVPLQEYVENAQNANYIASLVKTLQKLYDVGEVAEGCALGFGGTGAHYIGHVEAIEDADAKAKSGRWTITRKGEKDDASGLDGMALVARNGLDGIKEGVIVVDEGYQPHSMVPVGGCGPEEAERLRKQGMLLSKGAVLSEVCVAAPMIASKEKIDAAISPAKMAEAKDDGAAYPKEIQGLYMPVTVVLDDTRRLELLVRSPLNMLAYLGELSDDKEKRFMATAIRLYDRYRKGQENPPEREYDAFIGEFAVLRDRFLTTLATNLGKNMRAAMESGLTCGSGAITIKDLSPKGGLADVGDLKHGRNDMELEGLDTRSGKLVQSWMQDLLVASIAVGVMPQQFVTGYLKKVYTAFAGEEAGIVPIDDRLSGMTKKAVNTSEVKGVPASLLSYLIFKFMENTCENPMKAGDENAKLAGLLTADLMMLKNQLDELKAIKGGEKKIDAMM